VQERAGAQNLGRLEQSNARRRDWPGRARTGQTRTGQSRSPGTVRDAQGAGTAITRKKNVKGWTGKTFATNAPRKGTRLQVARTDRTACSVTTIIFVNNIFISLFERG
jgi:hypothetical protein